MNDFWVFIDLTAAECNFPARNAIQRGSVAFRSGFSHSAVVFPVSHRSGAIPRWFFPFRGGCVPFRVGFHYSAAVFGILFLVSYFFLPKHFRVRHTPKGFS
ncbi:hypothetical protein [uncultured Draconibacterium sp.]|uniref:hypothetical protein n=1 Tax=uncultured Draconibacterium sp. TaxID=1573823 RepID=UPI0032606F0A